MGADYTLAEVLVYPVKACRGISVSSAAISSTGYKNLCIRNFGEKKYSDHEFFA